MMTVFSSQPITSRMNGIHFDSRAVIGSGMFLKSHDTSGSLLICLCAQPYQFSWNTSPAPFPGIIATLMLPIPDFATINRSVPQMPTGMEKEEETEHHLQRALSAQQVYGTSEVLVIPIPEIEHVAERYSHLYKNDFKTSKQFVHIQAFGMDQEIPDYDMDSEDENWVSDQSKKMEVSPVKFEEMMDRLEKGSGQQVVTLPEAKLLLKEDDDLIIAVYDYWLNKRLKHEHPLIMQVKTEKRDGSTTNNPYVAFRRRTEKMQTRKNRKNDETSYEKMLKLKRDLNRAVTILEMIKRREKAKKELLQLNIEIVDKRYQLEDYEGKMLQEAEAIRHKMPSFTLPIYSSWGRGLNGEESVVRKKREYKKRKYKHANQQSNQNATVQHSHYNDIDVLHPEVYSSDDEPFSPGLSPSDHEDENDPDGPFAFKRRKNCNYYAPILGRLGNWPWCGPDEGGTGEKKYRYNLTSISQPPRCVGYGRRRVGRGGRILIDRSYSEWDDVLHHVDNGSGSYSGTVGDYITYIREKKIPHFRPHSPTPEDRLRQEKSSMPSSQEDSLEFNLESFQSHKEQLRQMQRNQQEKLLKQESTELDVSNNSLEHSFSSQPTSRFTLDSDSAKFAVTAVLNSSQIHDVKPGANISSSSSSTSLIMSSLMSSVPSSSSSLSPIVLSSRPCEGLISKVQTVTSATTVLPSISSLTQSLTNGPVLDSVNIGKTHGLSTSPAANVLQLNFPLNNNTPQHTVVSSTSNLSSSLSSVLTSSSAFSSKGVSNATLLKNLPAFKNSKSSHDEVGGHINSINNIKPEKVVAMDVT